MTLVYRKYEDDLEWHFHTQCPGWPETEYVETRFVEVSDSERLCQQCSHLESEKFPAKD
jgi:hypothetical protein